MKRAIFPIAAALISLAVAPLVLLHADEGMWTFDNPPTKQIQEKYGFTVTPQWLDHVRLSSVRLNDGGSGSFVSPNGLLLTNHHVARGQLQKNSNAQHDYNQTGFLALTSAEEMKSPDLEVNVLVSMENVTARVSAALKGAKSSEDEFAKRKDVIATIERESLEKTGFRSDVVTLYQGGEYWLYRYKKYTDVRIVFAPEEQIAFFGGDPDNFTYPRYDLDLALFRVYENGKPIHTDNYLKWNPKGAVADELVFVSGHPGSTSRLDTLSQLEIERDMIEPATLKILHNRIDTLRKYSATGPEAARQAGTLIFGLENSLKAYEGRLKGLQDPRVMGAKKTDEAAFKAKVMANTEWRTNYGKAWDQIAAAETKGKTRFKEQYFHGLYSQYSSLAQQIVQYVSEIKKPDGQRLASFHEAQLESLRLTLFSGAPIYPEMEIARITGALELDVAEAGPNDPWVKLVLNGKTPREVATELVRGTKLGDPEVRKKLIEGGEAAVAASTDTMIVLARKLDPARRELVKWSEDNVDSVVQRAGEQLGKARFAAFGKNTYPDATFTLRLSYGQVKGYPMNGTIAAPVTTLYGLYDRSESFQNKAPFDLPKRWVDGRSKLNLATPMDFVTSNDIIGGNSGSPVVNKAGEIVGLIFDGNIESLVGDFVYEGVTNRAVAVHTGAMTEALSKLYGAQKIVDELLTGK
ncbi:MAG: S46 family peptidase [Acidobacteriota bacterium]